MALNREKVIQAAEKYVSRGKIDAAIKEYRKVLDENPNDIGTLNRVGDLYARLDRNDEATRLFQQIAQHYTAEGFFVKAIAIYKKIIKLDPTRLEVYEKLADLYHKQGLTTEARAQYMVLADYYQKHSNPASAIGIHQKMVSLEPENPTHHVNLAELYQAGNLLDKAIGEYKVIAELMLRHGKVEEAAKVYQRALDVDSSDLGFITEAVLGLRQAGHTASAARLLSIAVEKNPQAEKVAQLAGMRRDRGSGEQTGVGRISSGERAGPKAASASAAPGPIPQPEPPPGDLDLEPMIDLEERLSLDLDLDEVPRSLVQPPADLAPLGEGARSPGGTRLGPPAPPVAPAEDEFVLDLDAAEGELATPAPAPPPAPRPSAAPPAAPPATGAPPQASDEPGEEIEWELDLDSEGLELPSLDRFHQPPSTPEPGPEAALEADDEAPQPFSLGLDEEVEVELELELEEEPPLAAAVEAPPELALPRRPHLDLDTDLLEQTASEVAPIHIRREEDLLAEAEVFAKYGLQEKAQDRLREVLQMDPNNLQAYSQLILLTAEQGKGDRVLTLARQMAEVAARRNQLQPWHKLRQRLAKLGYRFEGEEFMVPEKTRRDDTVSMMLQDLVNGNTRPGGRQAPRRPPPPPAPPPAAPLAAAEDEELEGFVMPRQVPAPEERAAAALDDTGMSWLDEAADGKAPAGSGDDKLFAEEEFFDLAAELESELNTDDRSVAPDLLVQPQEQSLAEIVEGFKKGVAENLSSEDYDTHYNLGIAYREMGLLDEAIGEFQLAAKDTGHLADCCAMLGVCFLEKGLPELAVKWYRRGLESPRLSEDNMLGLMYDLGDVYLAMGDADAAHNTFVDIYGINSNYRDVVAKLAELRRGE